MPTAGGSTRIDVPAPGAGPLLPRELLWLYPLVPFITSALLIDDFFEMDRATQLRKFLSTFIPFVAIAGTFHPLYHFVVPGLLRRLPERWHRAALHLVLVVGGSTGISLLIRPLHNAVCGKDLQPLPFAISSVIISCALIFPSLLIQAQRNRTQAVERLAQAERQAALKAQLEALQARTNPHFFFNSINTVASLIPDDPALAERTLERLADLFRYALDSNKTRAVPLKREFDMVTDYLAIQTARFGSRLESKVSLDPQVANYEVPPLMLQPLVENAILHGLADRKRGRVEVSARREGDRVIIEVRDDGPGPGASKHRGTQTSVKDMGERVRLAFGESSHFGLEAAPGGGCLARLALPAV
ncbi:MAG: histidine kinase [Myxococcaceae bacterium]|jgi:two-component system sensor histidine kinase AlgZ|nr:histidine kinase [Myxococcaceae bacterium]